MEYSHLKNHFLDLLITVNENRKLETSMYQKETDRNTILHSTSFHPERMISNILYGQFVRLRRICSKEEDYQTTAKSSSNVLSM